MDDDVRLMFQVEKTRKLNYIIWEPWMSLGSLTIMISMIPKFRWYFRWPHSRFWCFAMTMRITMKTRVQKSLPYKTGNDDVWNWEKECRSQAPVNIHCLNLSMNKKWERDLDATPFHESAGSCLCSICLFLSSESTSFFLLHGMTWSIWQVQTKRNEQFSM